MRKTYGSNGCTCMLQKLRWSPCCPGLSSLSFSLSNLSPPLSSFLISSSLIVEVLRPARCVWLSRCYLEAGGLGRGCVATRRSRAGHFIGGVGLRGKPHARAGRLERRSCGRSGGGGRATRLERESIPREYPSMGQQGATVRTRCEQDVADSGVEGASTRGIPGPGHCEAATCEEAEGEG